MNLRLTILACFSSLLCSLALAEPEPSKISAQELAGRLSAKQQADTSLIRARMETGGKDVLQIQIKSRASRGSTELVYQVLFPKERKGEAVLLRKSGGRISGSLFSPSEGVRSLGAGQMDEPLFGSDLSYEDVIDNFLAWDQQAVIGTEVIDRVPCTILESKPGKGVSSSYSRIRTWVDTRRWVPLRIEKYGSGDRVIRRIETTRVVNDDQGRPIPANLSIRGPRGSITQLDGSRIKHGIAFSDAVFSPEGLQQLNSAAPAPE